MEDGEGTAQLHQGLLSQPVRDGASPLLGGNLDGHDSQLNSLNRKQNQTHLELESLHVSIGKRLYAQLNVLVMCANTIAAVFSISAAVSLIPKDDDFELMRYDFCTYGPPLTVEVQCPYHTSPVFLTFLIIWSLYFITLFVYKFHGTYDYWSNDLRFYLVHDMLNNTFVMFVFVIIGMVLTLVSCVGGIVFVCQNGSIPSISSILVFTGVNLYNLHKMFGGEFAALKNCHLHKDFPVPIMIDLSVSRLLTVQDSSSGAKGGIVYRKPVDHITATHKEVLDFIIESVLRQQLETDEQAHKFLLRRIGDAALLEDVVKKLTFIPPSNHY